MFKVYPDQPYKSEDPHSPDDDQETEPLPRLLLGRLAQVAVPLLPPLNTVYDHRGGDGGAEGQDHHDKVNDIMPRFLAEKHFGTESDYAEDDFNDEVD